MAAKRERVPIGESRISLVCLFGLTEILGLRGKKHQQGIIIRTDFVVMMNAYLIDDDADDDEHIDSDTLRSVTKQRRTIIELLSQDSEANQFLPTIVLPSQPQTSQNAPFSAGSVVRQPPNPAAPLETLQNPRTTIV
jgi:hypothetical protein